MQAQKLLFEKKCSVFFIVIENLFYGIKFMKASDYYISTLKEAPADAEIISHQPMMRAGMIKRISAGIYNYMPLGLRVIRKVENIVREEMDRSKALEMTMPVVQPAELWQETNRWEQMGEGMLRFKDRHDRSYTIQPTSEEVVTDMARQELRSYKSLPKNFYQIQTKFRDERRPRFGLLRGREFTMMDAYSFDRNADAAQATYRVMYDTYKRIFDRFGLTYRAVSADSGDIGGDLSHEFQVIAGTGEDAIIYSTESDYAANIEKAVAVGLLQERLAPTQTMTKVPTPGASTCANVAKFLGLPLTSTVKSIVLATEKQEEKNRAKTVQIWLLLIRGDHDLNEVKVSKLPGLEGGHRFASTAEIEDACACKPGYLGPVGLSASVKVIADKTVAHMSDFVCGANEEDCHITGVNWGRDLPEPLLVADIRNVVAGDPSPDGKGVLAIQRGIEIGHVFYLGTKYAKDMNATYLDENGKPQYFEMGCYGIGITRILGAAIEQNYDARGMVWPDSLAPFTLVVCPIGYDRSENVRKQANELYENLRKQGIDVILDDRGERPGAMFADWELIGVPHRIVISERGLQEGQLEYQGRCDKEAGKIAADGVLPFLLERLTGKKTQ